MQVGRKRILITGAAGMLGSAFVEHFSHLGYSARALDHTVLDVTNLASVMNEAEHKPEWIIHCAGNVNADFCEENKEECFRSHVEGTRNIIKLAQATDSRLFYPQSFLIFNGIENPITEETAPHPLSVYGEAKLEAENIIRTELPDALIVRIGGFFGGFEKDKNFVGKFANFLKVKLDDGTKSIPVSDRVWQPTYTKDLAENITLLLEQNKSGIYNMASHGHAAFFEVANAMVDTLGIGKKILISSVPAETYKEKALRPNRAIMSNNRLTKENLDHMQDWKDALKDYLSQTYFQNIFK